MIQSGIVFLPWLTYFLQICLSSYLKNITEIKAVKEGCKAMVKKEGREKQTNAVMLDCLVWVQ